MQTVKLFPHVELSITIVAPDDAVKCQVVHCKYENDFKMTVRNDNGKIVMSASVCRKHLILSFIEAFEEASATS